MTSPSSRSPLTYIVALLVVAVVLGAGLGRFGIWQPQELRMADLARDGSGESPVEGVNRATPRDPIFRPPLQVAAVRVGFRAIGPTEVGGRLPTALFAILATMALALAVGAASDARSGAFVGIAYATMPLVFLNARQMFGGGIAQSAFTLFFASFVYVIWGRPPASIGDPYDPASRDGSPTGMTALWLYGRWALLATGALAVLGAGVMLGIVPVLIGIGLALVLRWRYEPNSSRMVGLALAVFGAALAIYAVRASVAGVREYSALLGVGPDARPPSQFSTYEAFIEQIGHATFPWTGIVMFGVVRLIFPVPVAAESTADIAGTRGYTESAAWRESGARLGAFVTLVVAYGLQSFHLQQFGISPFIAAAPLAVAGGFALRDAEREASGWRLITACATFITVIMVRDYELFPKSSYAALGLADGGPAFPSGFTGTLKEWFRVHGARGIIDLLTGRAIGEVFFLLEGLLFIVISLSALFQGAGNVAPFPWLRPYTWMIDVERSARVQLAAEQAEMTPALRWVRYLTGFGFLSFLRLYALIGSVLVMSACFIALKVTPNLSTPLKSTYTVLLALPIVIVAGTYGILLLWNIFALIGNRTRDNPVTRLLGSRIAFVLAGAVLVALVMTQLYIPALSEHLSPRGVWAVIRRVRRGEEPVARYGGNQGGDRATRYYANFDVHDIPAYGEPEAVEWLTTREPRHFMVVGADVFPALNRAYRRALPEGHRRNVPVLDATNSNLYVATSDLQGSASHNPLDPFVLTTEEENRQNQALGRLWHPHGRMNGNEFVEEPARFDDALEYIGFTLDSNNQSFIPVGGTFRITYHFRVLREIVGSHQIFVHVDGPCPRVNGDHPPVNDRYPVRYWLPGDVIHDQQQLTVPSYCRGGRYFIYLGFFQGDDRMRITGGDHDRENRVVAARINVR